MKYHFESLFMSLINSKTYLNLNIKVQIEQKKSLKIRN